MSASRHQINKENRGYPSRCALAYRTGCGGSSSGESGDGVPSPETRAKSGALRDVYRGRGLGRSRIHEPGETEPPGEIVSAGGAGRAGRSTFSCFAEQAVAKPRTAIAITGRHFIGKTSGPEEALPTMTSDRVHGQPITRTGDWAAQRRAQPVVVANAKPVHA